MPYPPRQIEVLAAQRGGDALSRVSAFLVRLAPSGGCPQPYVRAPLLGVSSFIKVLSGVSAAGSVSIYMV